MSTIGLQTMSHTTGNRMTPDLSLLPDVVRAPRTDPIYNCHSYLTKVPVAAIKPFLSVFTEPGDLVVDPFAGSGMTGMAAFSMRRRAMLSDISVLGQHIGKGYLVQVQPTALRGAALQVVSSARKRVGDFYTAERKLDGAKVDIARTVWSFSYICPACSSTIIYFEHLSPAGKAPAKCPSCGSPFERRSWARGKDVPVEVVVEGRDGRLTAQPVTEYDRKLIDKAAQDSRLKEIPSLPIDEHREMYKRSALRKAGLTNTSDFFSARNAIALSELWQEIASIDDPGIRQKLRFAFTAILGRASRRYQWGPKRPLNAQNQTYYIAPVYYEWNVFDLFNRKVEASLRADEALRGGPELSLFLENDETTVDYVLSSADSLKHLKSESVDYAFTDPPFGSNIFYSDMSLFHEAWIGRVTDNSTEAVVHTTGSKKLDSAQRYESLLRGAFQEAFRVLKPGRYLSVVFGNSDGKIWGLVQRSLRDAGFTETPAHVAILDKGQRSVKGLNSGSEGVVTVDLVLTVRKPHEEVPNPKPIASGVPDINELIHETIDNMTSQTSRNPSYVYAHLLRSAIKKHLPLDSLHLDDVLVALRQAGYQIDKKSGSLILG